MTRAPRSTPRPALLRSSVAALVLAGATTLTACAGDQTAILVEVSSDDLSVPEDVDGLRFEATSELGASVDRSFAIQDQWPHSLTIVPPESQRMGGLTITITATRGGQFVMRRVVAASFEAGRTRRIAVTLGADCVGLMCPGGVDCAAGRCVGVVGPDAGVDGGREEDAGVDDAGLDAGGDAGPGDSGFLEVVPLVINEVDYDQQDTDVAEFVEVLNVGDITVDLTGFQLVLMNGSSQPAVPYNTTPLTGTLAPDERLVLSAIRATDGGPGPVVAVPEGVRFIAIPDPMGNDGNDVIQNGGGDAVVLWDNGQSRVIDALLYEGQDGAMGVINFMQFPLIAGARASIEDPNSGTTAFCRNPDGADTGNDAIDWALCASPTPGAPNVP